MKRVMPINVKCTYRRDTPLPSSIREKKGSPV